MPDIGQTLIGTAALLFCMKIHINCDMVNFRLLLYIDWTREQV